MQNEDKSKEYLINELNNLRQQVAELEAALEQHKLDKERLDQQVYKLQRVGPGSRLTQDAASDLGHLMVAIDTHAEFLLGCAFDEEEITQHIRELKTVSERASSISRQLLALGRRSDLALRVLAPNALIANLDKVIRRVIGPEIQMQVLLDPDLGRIYADSGQIEQIILNLAVNARDAMPSGGRLTIKTANVELDQAVRAVRPGEYVMLEVSDTGVGISEAIRSRIFEPFFTTKTPYEGKGLGLAVVLGIVTMNDGQVMVDSQVGQGSTFRVYLPRVPVTG